MKIFEHGKTRIRQVVAAALVATTAFAPLAAQAQAVSYTYLKYVKDLPPEVPAGGASPAVLEFGEVQLPDTSPWRTVTFANQGSTDLTIGAVTAPAGYEVQNGCPGLLLAEQSCAVQVRFVPTAPGVANGTLSIASSSYNSPALVALNATATQPVASFSPNPVNLGDVEVGQTSSTVNLSVTNTGTGVLQLASLTFGGSAAGFTVTEGTCGPLPKLLGSQESCALTVNVTPSATGVLAGGVVNATTNDVAGSHSVPLQATGVQAGISLTPGSLAFGDVLVGTTSTSKTITVANTGTGELRVSTITRTGTAAGQFTATNNCGAPVAPGGSCVITVAAAPTSAGAKSASIEIVSNAPTSPSIAGLTANAIQGTVSLNPTSWDFGTVVVGP